MGVHNNPMQQCAFMKFLRKWSFLLVKNNKVFYEKQKWNGDTTSSVPDNRLTWVFTALRRFWKCSMFQYKQPETFRHLIKYTLHDLLTGRKATTRWRFTSVKTLFFKMLLDCSIVEIWRLAFIQSRKHDMPLKRASTPPSVYLYSLVSAFFPIPPAMTQRSSYPATICFGSLWRTWIVTSFKAFVLELHFDTLPNASGFPLGMAHKIGPVNLFY